MGKICDKIRSKSGELRDDRTCFDIAKLHYKLNRALDSRQIPGVSKRQSLVFITTKQTDTKFSISDLTTYPETWFI